MNKEVIHFGDLDYTIREEEDKFVLESTTKNKYGYKRIITCPKKDEGNNFEKKIEDFLLREIF